MIRPFAIRTSKSYQPSRRRVSNILAAFAALMLIASAQVGKLLNESSSDMAQADASQVELQADQAEAALLQVADQNDGDTNANLPSRKSKGVKLSLFRFGR